MFTAVMLVILRRDSIAITPLFLNDSVFNFEIVYY